MNNRFSINQVEQLLKYTGRSKGDYKHFNPSLCTISCLLEGNSTENILLYINKLLKSSRINEEVYICLENVMTCVSKDVIVEQILFWTQCILEKSNEKCAKRYDIISSLIQIGKENQDFNKLMHSSLLLKVIDECLSIEIDTIYIGSALTCLATCLETYSSSCGHLKNKIESYLIQFLYSNNMNTKLIKYAALCFQKLQKVGNPGIDSTNYKNNWKTSFEKLCVTIDVLYDTFFEDVDEFYSYEKLILDPYVLPEFPKVISSIEVFYSLENRLQATCLFLRGMLENEFSHTKCIRLQYVLDIIIRVLSLHICVNNNSETMFHVGMLLIKTQINILYLLRSLIAVLELNLLQFSAAVSKLLLDSLTRTRNCSCFKNASEYTETLYKVLNFWIKSLGNCLNTNVHDKIVNLIIDDISPITTDVSLNISNTGISGKAKKRAMLEKIISSSVKNSSLENYSKNMLRSKEQICYQALSCLSALLTNVNLSIRDNTSSLLYNTLIQAILSVQNGRKLFPYCSDNIKIKLFETLVTTLECSKLPPSIGLIVNILRDGQKSNNAALMRTCSVGLNILEKICQPVCPSMNFIHENRSISNFDETIEEFVEISQPLTKSPNGDEEIHDIHNVTDSGAYTENVTESDVDDTIIKETLENINTTTGNMELNEESVSNENNVMVEHSLSELSKERRINDEQLVNVDTIIKESLENINTSTGNMQPNEESVSNENNVMVEHSISELSKERSINDEQLVNVEQKIEIMSGHPLAEDDCAEPVQKKIKTTTAEPGIEEMLDSFVDL